MSRTNIVKCKTQEEKLHVYSDWCKKDNKVKSKFAKQAGISVRTLGRIIAEFEKGGIIDWDYCLSKKELTVFKDGNPRSIKKSFPRYSELVECLHLNNFADLTLSTVYDKMCILNVIKNFSEGSITVKPKDGVITYGTFEIKHTIVDRIFLALEQGKTVTHLVKFLDKLMENPDKHIVEQLYPFLSHNTIKINEDGDIIAYRGVTKDYKDAHTGTMDNSVGNVLKMPRNLVNTNPEQTCSTGLHVAAREYAEGWSSRLLKVRVNPKNVCSVPVDYNGQKMRVCEFEVLSEVKK